VAANSRRPNSANKIANQRRCDQNGQPQGRPAQVKHRDYCYMIKKNVPDKFRSGSQRRAGISAFQSPRWPSSAAICHQPRNPSGRCCGVDAWPYLPCRSAARTGAATPAASDLHLTPDNKLGHTGQTPASPRRARLAYRNRATLGRGRCKTVTVTTQVKTIARRRVGLPCFVESCDCPQFMPNSSGRRTPAWNTKSQPATHTTTQCTHACAYTD